MTSSIEVLFSPPEFAALTQRELSDTTCVVFDVLRATSTMVTALANGAQRLIPVVEVDEAVAWRRQQPEVLLAGERQGLRIGARLTGGVEFDLGNSPREFTPERVAGRTIVITTTNGTRALRACLGAARILVASWLNLGAVAAALRETAPARLVIVCSGTLEQASFEDTLAAGALADRVWSPYAGGTVADSAAMARELYRAHAADLPGAMRLARNGRRLLAMPELRDDVAWCLTADRYALVPALGPDGAVC